MTSTETKLNDKLKKITLQNDKNISIALINLGGRILNIFWQDSSLENKKMDLTMQYEDLDCYKNDDLYLNTLIGRTAGRINPTNFKFNNKNISLSQNEGKTNLLGGFDGLHNKYFDTKIIEKNNSIAVEFRTLLKDNEDGFPGNMKVKVVYILNNKNEFIIEYHAFSDQDTLCNLTNHIYLNMNGIKSGEFINHKFINGAQFYYDVDDNILPIWNNKIIPPKEYNYAKKGWREKLLHDNPFVLNQKKEIEIYGMSSFLKVNIKTTYPSYVLYTHNYPGKNKLKYHPINSINLGFVIETQYLPNDIHNDKSESLSILKKDKKYFEKTVFKFQKFKN